jgi:hypothetical protein
MTLSKLPPSINSRCFAVISIAPLSNSGTCKRCELSPALKCHFPALRFAGRKSALHEHIGRFYCCGYFVIRVHQPNQEIGFIAKAESARRNAHRNLAWSRRGRLSTRNLIRRTAEANNQGHKSAQTRQLFH